MINKNKKIFKKNKWNSNGISAKEWLSKIKEGDTLYLSKAISLVESNHPSDQKRIQEIAALLSEDIHSSIVLAITGPPGVGKSTFINSLGLAIVEEGSKVAVLSIDPSDPDYGGSVLGDKTRMGILSLEKNAFIRPSPSARQLGGVASGTRLAIKLCAHAGYDFVLIETVGVGQSEIYARHMSDLFILLDQPGAGDDLQGIKKGIVQVADMIIITKADGDLEKTARQSKQAIKMAQNYRQWNTVETILAISSLNKKDVRQSLETIKRLFQEKKKSGMLDTENRRNRKFWINQYFKELLVSEILDIEKIEEQKETLENDLGGDEQVVVYDFIQKNIIQKLKA